MESSQSTDFLDESLLRIPSRYHEHNPYDSLSSLRCPSQNDSVFDPLPLVIPIESEPSLKLGDPKEFTF